MEFASLQPDLQQWIRQAVSRGHRLSTLMEALMKAGYQPDISAALTEYMAEVERNHGDGGSRRVRGPERFRVFEYSQNTLQLEDREIQVLLNLKKPNVTLFSNLLSHWECDALIEQSREKLRSPRAGNAPNGQEGLVNSRISSGTYFKIGETPTIAAVESRISRLLNLSVSRGEPTQVRCYAPGEEYKPRYDFFDPSDSGSQHALGMGGQRIATLILYLSDVEAGGATVFPKIGLKIPPRRGFGLLFSYSNSDGELDYQTFHGGSPVVAGEQWVATKWLRVNDYCGLGARTSG